MSAEKFTKVPLVYLYIRDLAVHPQVQRKLRLLDPLPGVGQLGPRPDAGARQVEAEHAMVGPHRQHGVAVGARRQPIVCQHPFD